MHLCLLYQDGWSPLLAACSGGHTETAQLLIYRGADVNETDEVSALYAQYWDMSIDSRRVSPFC